MVFLMETLLCNKQAEFFRIKLKFDYMFVVDRVGRSGGLILLWNAHKNVMIHNFSRRHINAIVTIGRNGIPWKFSGFMVTQLQQRDMNRGDYYDISRDYYLLRGYAWETLMR
jgi:hypothetical protein